MPDNPTPPYTVLEMAFLTTADGRRVFSRIPVPESIALNSVYGKSKAKEILEEYTEKYSGRS